MNQNNILKTQMMNTIIMFIKEKGRDVRENAVRAYIKKQFPMDNEREQMLWVASAFRSLEEEKAIVHNGAVVGLTIRGEKIARRGGMERNARREQWSQTTKIIGSIFSIIISAIGVYDTANDSGRNAIQVVVTATAVIVAGFAIYSLLASRYHRQ